MWLRSKIIKEEDDDVVHRNSIGGRPILPIGVDWPTCPTGGKMVFVFQVDIPSAYVPALVSDWHMAVFMSPHDVTAPQIAEARNGVPLPERFWDKYGDYLCVVAHKCNEREVVYECDSYLEYKRLDFEELQDSDEAREILWREPSILIGGDPMWIQDPMIPLGPKGEELIYVAQVCEEMSFKKRPEAPEQRKNGRGGYILCLATQTFFFLIPSVTENCAVWVDSQAD